MNIRGDLIREACEKLNARTTEHGGRFYVLGNEYYTALLFDEISLYDTEDNRPDCPRCSEPKPHMCPDATVEGIVAHAEEQLRVYVREILAILETRP